MAERTIATVLKTVGPSRVPGVRIPLPPLEDSIACSRAGRAAAVQIQFVMVGREPGRGASLLEDFFDELLAALVEAEIGHRAAVVADQMMVMAHQPLGQLKPGPIRTQGDPVYGPDPPEHVKVSIDRALDQAGVHVHQLGKGHRPLRGGQQADEATPGRGVALIKTSQRPLDPVVDGINLNRHTIHATNDANR